MKDKHASLRSLINSLLWALCASLLVLSLWMAGVLASLESAFLLSIASETNPAAAPQMWLGALMILAAGLSAGFAVERGGAKRSVPFILGGLVALVGVSLLLSRLQHIDVAFAPMALAALSSAFVVQLRRLWMIDKMLTRSLARAASQTSKIEGGSSHARLMSGLKLLETVLPLEEAVIFQPDENGHLAPAARLRSAASGSLDRNSAWRAGVRLCERAVELGAMVTKAPAANEDEQTDTPSNVALALRHEGRAVGALLVRLRERFDESDRPLLLAVGEQLARNFQRDESRKRESPRDFLTLISARAAESRLEAFGVVSGLLTEQRFGAEVLAEASDGHAVAYLDGTLAYVNPPLLTAARLSDKEAGALDLFTLLDRFRAGVFDEPSIAVRRVLQTGDAYERELHYPERNQTLELRIALVTERVSDNGDGAQPLCLAVTVRDVTRIKEYEKLKSDMISLMSHELRTPITSINGFAELLMNDEAIPAEAREFLSIINAESQRLSRMINTFLTVTQLEAADKQEVLKIPLKLDDVVRETLASLQPVAKKKRIRLVEQPSTRLPPVAADRSLITQVVTNLVGNAIKYSPERTTVTVSTQLEADTVRLCVEDRGYGIPPESVDSSSFS